MQRINGLHVLSVEVDETNQQILAGTLRRLGITQIHATGNTTAGISALENSLFQICFVGVEFEVPPHTNADNDSPDKKKMCGKEFIRHVRREPMLRHQRIIMIYGGYAALQDINQTTLNFCYQNQVLLVPRGRVNVETIRSAIECCIDS